MAQENQIQIFRYNGSPVTFQGGNNVMVNATEMDVSLVENKEATAQAVVSVMLQKVLTEYISR